MGNFSLFLAVIPKIFFSLLGLDHIYECGLPQQQKPGTDLLYLYGVERFQTHIRLTCFA